MKTAAMLLIFFMSTACTTATEPPLNLRPLARGTTAAYRGNRHQAILVFGERVYRDVWKRMVSEGEPPPVDFTKEYAVILLAGERPTGGFSIEPKQARVDGRVLIVEATLREPGPDDIVTQALTSPWAAVAVPIVEVDIVRWQQQ